MWSNVPVGAHMFSAITTNNNYINHIHQPFLHPTAPSLLEKAAKVQSLTPTKAWMMPGWPKKNQQKKWHFTKEKQDLANSLIVING